MKKFAITLSAATLLLGGLVGCWDAPQGTTGLGADQRGFGYHQTDQRDGAGFTGQRAGEGPITDMFTRDDRRGARGFGRDTRRPGTGLAGERGITGQHGGMTGQFGADRRGGATGAGHGAGGAGIGGAGVGGAGHGAGGAGIGGAGVGGAGHGAGGAGIGGAGVGGAGIGGAARSGHGAGFGIGGGAGAGHGAGGGAGFGASGATGFDGATERGTGLGMRGQTGFGGAAGHPGGMTGAGRGTQVENRIPGVGGAGIVGDRAGYVDDRGILRGRDGRGTTGRAGIGGLGQTGRTLQDERAGVGTRGAGRDADVRLGDRITPDTERGMRNFAYPEGYDTQTVQRINTRLADVENVRDSRVIVHDNRILVGVDADGDDIQRVEQDVRRTVGDMAGDREVTVVTERDQFNRVRTVDDRLRGGEAIDEVGATITEMFGDFGRAVQRPFERTR
ncbi:hypothetical protein BKP35_18795 [Anaerobacillus arseniciselenatis]|uniref:Sporulation protein n=1 Tax=Anaerobacillus arseniciselenatis TaxID=85682 RepID=A0A1S2L6V6_9BACI|nr:YhcN/YlaJ family sporulation lipoprotein [Anaerobacillus arseniciselenatis]OIJ07723.1 hypothetical protein BKP35_18795 [Anaerobacillus arseniciselenatis]